jgi:pimeloyl-ACP methyl ester carboxylesterase
VTTATRVWTEKFVDMSHGKTRYWEAGTGYPTILIHGAGWTSGPENWVQNIGPLANAGLRVLAIDCLNWGTGDIFDQEFSFAYLVDHVREFMDVLGIEKANFVGHSMGGWLVTLLSYESPDRINKVVNVDGGGTATRPLQNMVEFKMPEPDQIRQQAAGRAKASGLDVEELTAAPIKKRELLGHGEAFAKVMRHMTNPLTRQRYNTLRRMPFIKVPTLVVWGSDDKVNALEMGEATAKAIPNAKLVVYEGVGHAPPQEKPEQFNRDVIEFLTK